MLRAMRMRPVLLAAALAVAAPPFAARAGDATGATASYEDLIEVLATLTWHLRDDVYRFPPPKDPTGHDLYKLALTRLESWEKRFPGRMRDVTAYGRAQALERLGEYQRAAEAYGQVAAHTDSPLAARAGDGAARARAFAEAAALPEGGDGVETQLGALRKKLDAWGKLVDQYKGTPAGSVALVEEERLERGTTQLVVDHRRDLERGDETAEKALRFLIQKHADSKNLPAHVLRLGDLYAEQAREYVANHERPLAFEAEEFLRRADRALDTYHKVAAWDGAREKPEGQARFAAMEAWKSATLARYR
jgi:tetratricopeptide (TPR) repeat protein